MAIDADRHGPLFQRFGVRGMPTVLFLDPEGTEVGRLGSRSPEGVKTKLLQITDKYRRRP